MIQRTHSSYDLSIDYFYIRILYSTGSMLFTLPMNEIINNYTFNSLFVLFLYHLCNFKYTLLEISGCRTTLCMNNKYGFLYNDNLYTVNDIAIITCISVKDFTNNNINNPIILNFVNINNIKM